MTRDETNAARRASRRGLVPALTPMLALTLALALGAMAGCGDDERAVRDADTAAADTAATRADAVAEAPTTPARDTTLWLLAPPGATAIVGPATTERELFARYGAANVRRANVHVGEGETEPGTALFPGDSLRHLEIVWADTGARDRPTLARARGAAWVAHPGVRIGSSLADVERSNGRPFTMTGFGWDYGGTAVSWDGGRLDSLPPGVDRLLVRFERPRDARMTDAESRQLSGDREIPSTNAVMRRIQPRVYMLEVRFR